MLDTILNNAASILSSIRILDIVDILIVAFAIYKSITFLWGTRARQLLKGLLVLLLALGAANLLNLYTVHFILSNGLKYGFMAIIVIFYPELRRALEYLGRGKFNFSRLTASGDLNEKKKMISAITSAVDYFSETQTGALIVLEREVALGDILEHGTIVNAEPSAALLETIFYEGSALHDGAVVIRDGKILAAGCVLPVSRNANLEHTLGTRHRAGLGISEVSDALALIVSEETGIISAASEGKLSRFLDTRSVEKMLYEIFVTDIEVSAPSRIFSNLFRRISSDDE